MDRWYLNYHDTANDREALLRVIADSFEEAANFAKEIYDPHVYTNFSFSRRRDCKWGDKYGNIKLVYSLADP